MKKHVSTSKTISRRRFLTGTSAIFATLILDKASVFSNSGNFDTYTFKQQTPQINWSTEHISISEQNFRSVYYEIQVGKAVVISPAKKTGLINLDNGELVLEIDTLDIPFLLDQNLIYLRPASQRLDALDIRTGATSWRYLSDEEAISNRPFFSNGNAAFIPLGSSKWVVLSTEDGNELWKNPDDNRGGIHSFQTDSFITEDYQHEVITSYDLLTGAINWELPYGSTILVDDNRLIVRTEEMITVYDIMTGEIVWSYLDETGYSTVHRYELDNINTYYTLYIPDSDGLKLGALDIENGQNRWFSSENVGWRENWTMLGEFNGKVILNSSDFGLMRGYDALTFELLWENDAKSFEYPGQEISNFWRDRLIYRMGGRRLGAIDLTTGVVFPQ